MAIPLSTLFKIAVQILDLQRSVRANMNVFSQARLNYWSDIWATQQFLILKQIYIPGFRGGEEFARGKSIYKNAPKDNRKNLLKG